MQAEVFPKLRQLCLRHGARFQAIDLRWGIRDEAGRDQQTMRMCLEEIERCRVISPRPNFIVLLGDRYGWRPLPAVVPALEFEAIKRLVADGSDTALLEKWYAKDTNALPAEYVLRPRTLELSGTPTPETAKAVEDAERLSWVETERTLQRILRTAAVRAAIRPPHRLKYFVSATEQEVLRGALLVRDAREHVFCFFRQIRTKSGIPIADAIKSPGSLQDVAALPANQTLGRFVDLDPSGVLDIDASTRLTDLKNRVSAAMPRNTCTYDATWTDDGITLDHIGTLPDTLEECLALVDDPRAPDTLCVGVWKSLARAMLGEIKKLKAVDELDREVADHQSFCKDRRRFFVGRARILRKIAAYLNRTTRHPIGVYGPPGSGKSALMARAIEAAGGETQKALISRFIGATPQSADVRTLIEGLCRQVSRRYGVDETTVPTEYRELVREFPARLALATRERPLVLFLDALDQLSDQDHGRNLVWLPATLPPHVRLIVSTGPGECQEALTSKLPDGLLSLEPLPPRDARDLLNIWLDDAKRTLTQEQHAEVISNFTRGGQLPLYLKLAFELAKRWKSYERIGDTASGGSPAIPPLNPYVAGIIRRMFAVLAADSNHGPVLVSRALGYMSTARNGLSEDEILDVLSDDEAVLEDFKARAQHEPPERRLPVVLWSRLSLDLAPYLTERIADGTSLTTFYHQQLRQVAEVDYLGGDAKRERHLALARYFGAQPRSTRVAEAANLRQLSELPYHQTHAALWDELYETLTDIDFLEAKCAGQGIPPQGEGALRPAAGVYALQEDFRRALELMPLRQPNDRNPGAGDGTRETLSSIHRALQLSGHVLVSDGSQLGAQLLARLMTVDDARTRLFSATIAGRQPTLYFLTLTPSVAQAGQGMVDILTGHHGAISDLTLSRDGRRAISASEDATVKVWDLVAGRELLTFNGHSDSVVGVALSADETIVCSASRGGTLLAWRLDTGDVLHAHREQWRSLQCIAVTPDAETVFAGDRTGLVRWVVGSEQVQRLLQAAVMRSMVVGVLAGGERIVAPDAAGTLHVWRGDFGASILTLVGNRHSIVDLAITADEKTLAGADGYGFTLWQLDGGRILCAIGDWRDGRLTGHTSWVRAIALTPDGSRVVTASADNTVRVWTSSTGKELAVLTGHGDEVTAVAISHDGERVVSGSRDQTLRMWDLSAASSGRGAARHPGRVTLALASRDGRRAITGSARAMKVWNLATGQLLGNLESHPAEVMAFASWPDGRSIVSASLNEDNTWRDDISPTQRVLLKIWDLESLREVRTLSGDDRYLRALAVTPDGERIVAVDDASFTVWRGSTSRTYRMPFAGYVTAIALTADSTRLVTASDRGVLRIWRLDTGKIERELLSHDGGVASLAATFDGRRLIVGFSSGLVETWKLESGQFENRFVLDGAGKPVLAVNHSTWSVLHLRGSRLQLIEPERRGPVAAFYGDSPLSACAAGADGRSFVVGEASGAVHFIQLANE